MGIKILNTLKVLAIVLLIAFASIALILGAIWLSIQVYEYMNLERLVFSLKVILFMSSVLIYEIVKEVLKRLHKKMLSKEWYKKTFYKLALPYYKRKVRRAWLRMNRAEILHKYNDFLIKDFPETPITGELKKEVDKIYTRRVKEWVL